jgi:hypothetical protein
MKKMCKERGIKFNVFMKCLRLCLTGLKVWHTNIVWDFHLMIYTTILGVQLSKWKTQNLNTIKPAHAVTCIKRSPFSYPVIENFIWIKPLLRDHLSYKATFSLSQRWPLKTVWLICFILLIYHVWWLSHILVAMRMWLKYR